MGLSMYTSDIQLARSLWLWQYIGSSLEIFSTYPNIEHYRFITFNTFNIFIKIIFLLNKTNQLYGQVWGIAVFVGTISNEKNILSC